MNEIYSSLRLPFKTREEGERYIFVEKRGDIVELFRLFKILSDYFKTAQKQERVKEYRGLWEWCVFTGWRSGQHLDKEDLIWIVSNQIVDAAQLGIDIVATFLRVMTFIALDPEESESIYNSMRRAVLENAEPVITSRGLSDLTLSSICKRLIYFQSAPNSVERSQFKVSLLKTLFSEIRNEQFEYYRPEYALNLFLSAMNFFIAVNPEEISLYVDLASEPRLLHVNDSGAEEAPEVKELLGLEDTNEQEILRSSSSTKQLNLFSQIRRDVDLRFTKGVGGEYQNIDGVIAFLDTQATEAQNERIRDLYYFDEEKGQFVWNSELLNEE